jgi:hypothetical protein
VIPLAFGVGSFALPWWARAALFFCLVALDLLFALLVLRVRTTRTCLFALLAASTFVAIELVDAWLTLWGTATTVSHDLGSPLEKGLVPAYHGEKSDVGNPTSIPATT